MKARMARKFITANKPFESVSAGLRVDSVRTWPGAESDVLVLLGQTNEHQARKSRRVVDQVEHRPLRCQAQVVLLDGGFATCIQDAEHPRP